MGDKNEISFRAVPVTQPIGTFYVGVMDAMDLVQVSVADVRRLYENEFDEYIGIQRRLSPGRSKELKKYVQSFDATFPTAIILAVNDENAEWNEDSGIFTLRGTEERPFSEIASIIDGQHRVDGLTSIKEEGFQVSVSIFVGADVATQANIFATVNLAQTKVNRSLVYDLLDYERKRSPQKSAHHIVVALDQISNSPFHQRIKRLGSATVGRQNETITQAALVESLLSLMSSDPMSDRNQFLRKFIPDFPSKSEHEKYPFRQMFLKEMDTEITKAVLHFFQAVSERWPTSWNELNRRGNVLPKTNGLKALMRFLKPVYLLIANDNREYVPSKEEYMKFLDVVGLEDDDFNTKTFPPGTSGEAKLHKILIDSLSSTPKKGRELF